MVHLTLTEFKNIGDDNNKTYGFRLYDNDGNNTYYNPYCSEEELFEETIDNLLDIIENDFSEYYDEIELTKEIYMNSEIINIGNIDKNITLKELL